MLARRKLGSSGPEITIVGFGAWAVGGPYRFGWGPQDDDESVAAIRHAVESGVNWIDTAAVYGIGHSEEVVRSALEPYRVGEDVLVATKCGRKWVGPRDRGGLVFDLRPDSIREECEQSLDRLGLDAIDLYQFHWPDTETGTPIEDSWATMLELVDEGKVRWAGVSNFDVGLLERCEAMRHVDSLQPPYSLIDRGARDELIPWCRAHGVGVVVYSPMASGLLTGKFDRDAADRLASDDWRRNSPQFQEPKLSRNLELVERLRPLAARLGVGLPALSVAWTLATPGVTAAIVGARSAKQVDGWLPAAGLTLDDDALAEVESALEETVAAPA
ncbi:MAG TPA: aldo/keto reductase [Actinomycetota bacterium]|nr:aldo/keto reductase [Actinomycetota bacterium]